MRVRIDIAIDREPELIIAHFVRPLDIRLREQGVGNVTRHIVQDLLWVHVDVRLTRIDTFDSVLEFLADADAPIGTLVYRRDWLGRKRDIVVLGPDPCDGRSPSATNVAEGGPNNF